MRNWLVGLGLIAACAGCCAPLLPLLAAGSFGGAGGMAFGRLFGTDWLEAACTAVVFAAVIAGGLYALARRRAPRVDACAVDARPSGRF